jgi:hypothetical protein
MTPSLSPSIVMACTMFVPLPAVKILQQTGIFSFSSTKKALFWISSDTADFRFQTYTYFLFVRILPRNIIQ